MNEWLKLRCIYYLA